MDTDSDMTTTVVIIGGGIVGVSTAYELARRGCDVALFDREHFDRSASTGNSGIIALGHPPMPRPGMVRDAIRLFFNPANPLYIPPRFDWQLIKWFWNFRKACSPGQFRHSMNVLSEMGRLAGECFDRIMDEEQLDCDYHRTGWLEVYTSEDRFEEGRRDARMLHEYGYEAVELPRDELLAQEPALQPHVLGAMHYPQSRFANPRRVLTGLAERARVHGAAIHDGVEVSRILVENGRAAGVELADGSIARGDTVVLAAGMWSMPLARAIGIEIPMQAGKGYHVEVTKPEPCITRACVLSESYVSLNPTCGGLRIGGTLEFSGINDRLVQKRLDLLVTEARRHLRGIDATRITSTWCGLRPCTADGLPVIGWAPQVANLFIATGHAMMGFALGPATGRLACECLVDGRPSMDITALSPGRFVRR